MLCVFLATPIRNRYRVCSKVPMRFPGRHLNLKLYTGRSMYTHTLYARFLYTPSCAYALPLRSPHTSLFFFNKRLELAIANPLRTVHTFSISRPSPSFSSSPRQRWRRPTSTFRALQNGNHIHSNLVRYSRWNKHFCWKVEDVSTLRDATKSDFPT